MASRILLGNLFGDQDKMTLKMWQIESVIYPALIGHRRAIIAKGNTIEGITAKE